MYRERIKRHLWPFLVLTSLVIILQYLILKPHLRYAFADVDWMFLLSFKTLGLSYSNPIDHLVAAWKIWGVYTYQTYYIGLIEKLFGMDYQNFQMVSIIFKVISTLSIYPLIYVITRNRLVGVLTTFLYGISYPSVGVMYTVVTSGLFVAIPIMNLFFAWYWYIIRKGKNSILDILIWVILFFTTFLLATERMYPLIPVVILIELFWWLRKDFSKEALFALLKRLLPFLILFLIAFLYKQSTFTLHSGNTEVTYQKLIHGNWHVLLSPVISLGSLFLPRDYWPLLGVINIKGFFDYLGSVITGPMITFSLFSVVLAFFISRKPLRFILATLFSTFILSIAIYILSVHHLSIPDSFKMSFDFAYMIPALIGSYVIVLILMLFIEWLEGKKKNSLLISMVGGIVISFIFIVTTWIPADYILVFTGVHRYLTIPAIGSSLLISGMIVIIFNKLRANKILHPFALIVFLLLVPYILLNSKVISDHMKYELEYTGTDAAGHIRMKNKLWSYLGNINKTEPSLFYFDESADHDNGYFDETTIMAGFGYWMRFRGRDVVDIRLSPVLFRSNLICPQPRSMCLDFVKEKVVTKNGVKGIKYGDVFYSSENFYAFRFIDKDIFDIKPEVVKAIGLD